MLQEISKLVGEMWHQATTEQKAPYIEQVTHCHTHYFISFWCMPPVLHFLFDPQYAISAIQGEMPLISRVLCQARLDKARYQEALNRYQQRLAAEGAEQGAAEESTEPRIHPGRHEVLFFNFLLQDWETHSQIPCGIHAALKIIHTSQPQYSAVCLHCNFVGGHGRVGLRFTGR